MAAVATGAPAVAKLFIVVELTLIFVGNSEFFNSAVETNTHIM